MITRVKIDGYKSFKNFELKMKPLMVIFGPNASGKSNLFDALNLLAKLITEKNVKDAFNYHRGLPLESYFRGKNENEGVSHLIEFEVDVKLTNSIIEAIEKEIAEKRRGLSLEGTERCYIKEKCLRYNLKIEITSAGEVRIVNERLAALKANGEPKKSRAPFIETIGNKIRLRMEGKARPVEYDIGLDHTIISERPYLPYYPHINAFYREALNWRFYYLDPKTLMREDAPIKATEYIGSRGEGLADFYYYLKEKNKKQFDNLKLGLRSLIPNIEEILPERVEEGVVRLYLLENGIKISSRVISEGTLRILGILAILGATKKATLIGYEEPENGVHPLRLKKLADIFKASAENKEIQILINSHSAEFVSYFEDKELFVCKKRQRKTEILPLKAAGTLFRQKMIRDSLADPSEEL